MAGAGWLGGSLDGPRGWLVAGAGSLGGRWASDVGQRQGVTQVGWGRRHWACGCREGAIIGHRG